MSEMGLREFGRLLDISGEAVRKAIKTGRIPASMVGKKVLRSGREVPVITDPESAKVAMGRNTNPAQSHPKAAREAAKRSVGRPAAYQPEPGRPAAPSVAESTAIIQAYKARLAKLEYDERSAKLVDADAVKVKFAGMVAGARSRMLTIPSKCKGRIPHLSIDDVAVIDALIREGLEDLANGR